MCPDYNQLPEGHLQRAAEEMERGSSIALHGVITSWGSTVSTLFCRDRPVNNSVCAVSAVGGASNHWSPTGGLVPSKLIQIHPQETHGVAQYLLAESNRWGEHRQSQEDTKGKDRETFSGLLQLSTCLSIPGKQADGLSVYELKGP